MINYLTRSDVDNAINTLKDYLNTINKNEYIYLIINLIKLSLLENDKTFTKPIIVLTYISRDNYNFDLSQYIQGFYIAISQNKLEQAKIYLDIIKDAKRIGQECIFIDSLIQVLDNIEKPIQNQMSQEEINIQTNTEIPVETISIKNEEREERNPKKEEEPSIIEEPADSINDLVKRDSEKEHIDRKCQELLNNHGIILLKPMDVERRKRVHEIIKDYPDIVSFSIGEDPNRQIVLRYKPPKLPEKIDIKKTSDNIKEAFVQGKYEECIELSKKLLSFGNPTPQIYATIGFCLIRTTHKNSAIDYLTVGNEISKQNNQKFDYSEVILALKGEITDEEKKPKFKMTEEEFTDEHNYGIENFEEINAYIIESGLDVESACISLGLNEEQRTRIKLLYAREYYSQGQYEKGDEFLKAALQNKNKSKFALKAIEELTRNKRFYINRNNNNITNLTCMTLEQHNKIHRKER